MHGSIVQAALAEPEIFYRMGQGQITEVIFQTRSGQDSRSRVKKEWGVVAEKFKEEAVIIQQEELVKNVYSMWLHADKISAAAKPGQFLGLYSSDGRYGGPGGTDCLPDRRERNGGIFPYAHRNAFKYYRTAGERFSTEIPKSAGGGRRNRHTAAAAADEGAGMRKAGNSRIPGPGDVFAAAV